MVVAPVFVINLTWVIIAAYYFLTDDMFEELLPETTILCFIGILFYNVGLFFSEVVLTGALTIRKPINKKEPQSKLVLTIIEVISIAIWVSLLLAVIKTSYDPGMNAGQFRQSFIDAWNEHNMAVLLFTLTANGLTFFYTYKNALSLKNQGTMSLRDIFPLSAVLFFSFSRTLILISCCTLVAAGVFWRKWAIRQAALFMILFIVIFFLLALITGKDPNQSEHSFAESVSLNFQVYFFGGVSGFNQAVATGSPHYDAYLTFPRLLYSILNPVTSFVFEKAPSYYEFVETPLPLNIFTFLYPPYHDFGFKGIIVFPFIYGVVHQTIFLLARHSSSFVPVYVLGFFTYAALMSVFDDQYIRGLPVFIMGLLTFAILDKFIFIRNGHC